MSKEVNRNAGGLLLLLLALAACAAAVTVDRVYLPKYKARFSAIEKERIIVSNKLTTAKIVQENLNHVRELIFNNMDLPGQPDTVDHESAFFEFVTSCVNDLKLKLVSVRPVPPVTAGRITTYGYDLEVEGDFFRFGELCAKFENNRRLVSVESFDVGLLGDGGRPGGADSKSGNMGIRVKMRVNTYRISKS